MSLALLLLAIAAIAILVRREIAGRDTIRYHSLLAKIALVALLILALRLGLDPSFLTST